MIGVALFLLLAPAADEAVRTNGTRLEGELRLSKSGQLDFTPATADVVEYRFAASPPPFRVAQGMLLTLPGGQHVSGVVKAMKDDRLRFRTAWAEEITVPRDSVVSLTHLPGWRPVAWTLKGESAGLLSKPGQSVTYGLKKPVDAGRIGVNVREQDAPAGARWLLEATFGKRLLRVTLAGEGESLSVDTSGLKGTARTVARAKEMRRLVIAFSAGSLRLTVDDEVLWYTLDAGPGGALTQARLVCQDLDRPGKVTGGVAFSEFALERAVDESRHPPGDPRQDELWLDGGDQLFGQVVAVDASGVEMKGKFGTRRYAWPDLRGWFPRPGQKAPPLKDGVRAGIRGGLRATEDVLEGTLIALDARQVRLRHAVLGGLTLPRDRVVWLRPIGK